MRYLLDTHIFLWWLNNDKKLKHSVREVIKDTKNQIFVSVASAWEISMKHRAGKLSLETSLQTCFEISAFELVNINLVHILKLDSLPIHHKDPFDRILIAQAKAENLIIITDDIKIKTYNVQVFPLSL